MLHVPGADDAHPDWRRTKNILYTPKISRMDCLNIFSARIDLRIRTISPANFSISVLLISCLYTITNKLQCRNQNCHCIIFWQRKYPYVNYIQNLKLPFESVSTHTKSYQTHPSETFSKKRIWHSWSCHTIDVVFVDHKVSTPCNSRHNATWNFSLRLWIFSFIVWLTIWTLRKNLNLIVRAFLLSALFFFSNQPISDCTTQKLFCCKEAKTRDFSGLRC